MNKLSFALIFNRPIIYLQLVIQNYLFNNNSKINAVLNYFNNKTGIEIGGPSDMFKSNGLMPIYDIATTVDGCNFSDNTTWEGEIKQGNNYHYQHNKVGYQFICDGVDVPIIPKNKYDFALSCNNLEHIANPLKAIKNWLTLLKTGGTIVLILPRKESNFDHKRPTTKIGHLIQDLEADTGEDDLTHLEEVLQLHDLKFDPLAGGFDNFKARGMDNFNNRCLHHHVFDLGLLEEMCNFFDLKILLKAKRVDNYIIVAKK